MTFIPRPESPSPSWATLSVDQWSALTVDEWAGLQVAGAFEAKYDAWNRLVKISDPKGTVQENEYDGRGYRTVTKTYEAGTLSQTRHIYYTDQWQAVEERLGSETTADRQFVWGVRYIDDLVLRDSSVSSTLDQRLYACQDANWNVTAVVNDAGSVQERYEYDPYGNTTVLTSTFAEREESAFDWETTYCGYRYDAATNLYCVRHRFYSATIGNWLTRDPIGYADGSNLYRAYFVPNGTDPSGLQDPFTGSGGFAPYYPTYGPGGDLPWPGGNPQKTTDRDLARKMCNGDPNCLRELDELFELVDRAEKETPKVEPTGPCGTWRNKFTELKMQKPPDWKNLQTETKYFSIDPPLRNWAGFKLADYHQAVQVTVNAGDQVGTFYLDAGTHLGGQNTGNLGGPDNVFLNVPPNLIPSSGIPQGNIPSWGTPAWLRGLGGGGSRSSGDSCKKYGPEVIPIGTDPTSLPPPTGPRVFE